jgi:hypothetical protein
MWTLVLKLGLLLNAQPSLMESITNAIRCHPKDQHLGQSKPSVNEFHEYLYDDNKDDDSDSDTESDADSDTDSEYNSDDASSADEDDANDE